MEAQEGQYAHTAVEEEPAAWETFDSFLEFNRS